MTSVLPPHNLDGGSFLNPPQLAAWDSPEHYSAPTASRSRSINAFKGACFNLRLARFTIKRAVDW